MAPQTHGRSRLCRLRPRHRPSTGRGKWAAGCHDNAEAIRLVPEKNRSARARILSAPHPFESLPASSGSLPDGEFAGAAGEPTRRLMRLTGTGIVGATHVASISIF